MFLLTEKYRLELRWDHLEYKDGICIFAGAYFSGPVLMFADQIQPNDNIHLDFFKQYFIIVDNVYIGKLSWGEVVYNNSNVLLKDCILTHKSEINKVPKLIEKDVLIIDCKNHESESHNFYTTYKTYVVNEDSQIYTFNKK